MPCNVLTVYAAVRSHVKDNYWYRMIWAASAAAACSHPACCEAPGGKDDVWAFGSPGVGFGLLGVWGTQKHHPPVATVTDAMCCWMPRVVHMLIL